MRPAHRVPVAAAGAPLEVAIIGAGITAAPCATDAETRDAQPRFGPHPQYGPRVLFAPACDGDGIACSVPGAETSSEPDDEFHLIGIAARPHCPGAIRAWTGTRVSPQAGPSATTVATACRGRADAASWNSE